MSYSPGDCVSVEAYGGTVRHVGIVTDKTGADGCPRVISTSQKWRSVIEQDWTHFADGYPVTPVAWYSRYTPEETVERARTPREALRFAALQLRTLRKRLLWGADAKSASAQDRMDGIGRRDRGGSRDFLRK